MAIFVEFNSDELGPVPETGETLKVEVESLLTNRFPIDSKFGNTNKPIIATRTRAIRPAIIAAHAFFLGWLGNGCASNVFPRVSLLFYGDSV